MNINHLNSTLMSNYSSNTSLNYSSNFNSDPNDIPASLSVLISVSMSKLPPYINISYLRCQPLISDYYCPYFEHLNCGEIYRIVNLKTGQSYVGQTKCVKSKVIGTDAYGGPIAKYDLSASKGRFQQHLQNALGQGKNKDDCFKFYQAIREYGPDCWQLSVVERCPLTELNAKERYYVKYYRCRRLGYNMVSGGKKKPKYYQRKYKNRR